MINVAKLHACLAQAVCNRLGWKARPMLNPAEPLFLHSRNQLTVPQQGCRGVGVKRIDSKNNQGKLPSVEVEDFVKYIRPLPAS
jgi:hypothetical protein